MLSAWVWMPYAARVLAHGLHFAYPAPPLSSGARRALGLRQPPTSFPLLLALGYAGLAGALLRRRAASLALACLTATLLLGWSELPHRLFFDWQPHALARLQSFRLLTLVRPLLFAAAALPLAAAWRFVRARTPLLGLAFPAGTLALIGAGLVCAATQSGRFPTGGDELRAAAQSQVEDPAGFEQLLTWAAAAARAAPRRFARLMWSGSENGIYHVTAETGLPAFFVGDGVALLLRERIEDNSKQSLRRFNVRWIASRGEQPGERRFGSYVVRELPEWDGSWRGSRKARARCACSRGRTSASRSSSRTPTPPRWSRSASATTDAGARGARTARQSRSTRCRRRPAGACASSLHGSRPARRCSRPTRRWLRTAWAARPPRSAWPWRRSACSPAGAARLAPRRARAIADGTRARARRVGAPARGAAAADRQGSAPAARHRPRGPGRSARAGRRVDGVPLRMAADATSVPRPRPDRRRRGIRRARPSVQHAVPDARDRRASVRAARGVPRAARAAARGFALGRRLGRRRRHAALRRAGTGAAAAQAALRARGWRAPTECELLLRTRGRVAQGATLVRQDAVDLDRSRDVPWAPDEPPRASPSDRPRRP
jgi:hypothetical protein